MMLPQDIMERLTPEEYEDLCAKVEEQFHQAFGVISILRSNKLVVIVELDDNTRHEVLL